MPNQNQAEFDRAVAAIDGDERISAFRQRILALFPSQNPVNARPQYEGGNHVFVRVNPCTVGWAPGTPANFIVGIYIPGLCYNGGGRTLEGAIRRANAYFDDWLSEQISKCIARAFGGDPHGWRAPHRWQENWDD